MRYIAAYLLLNLAGNANPSAEDIKKVLSSVGIESDNALATKVVGELNGKNVADVIAQGNTKLASIPSGGAAPAAAAAAAPAAAAAGAKKEEKKEAPKKKEESDDGGDMGFGLFD